MTGTVRYSSRAGRAVLLATVLGSGVAFLDSTVVNVALPHLARNLHAGFSTMQWVLDAYLLTLGSLVLVGGALGDVLGRRRVYLVGLVGFGIASAACGAAPNATVLILARAVQGVAGALLVPGSLALITATYAEEDRGRAIGSWSGLAGLASAVGPFVGGWLVDAASWRWVFYLNLPLIAIAVIVTAHSVPESRTDDGTNPGWRHLDLLGAALIATTLALVVVPLIETRALGGGLRLLLYAGGAVAFVVFLFVESHRPNPMVPLRVFRSRVFTIANVTTFVVYGGFGGALFIVAVQLQTALGYSALEAGAAFSPFTVMLLVFSPRVGALVPRVGARVLLGVGPIVSGVGLALLALAVPGRSYITGVLPGVLVLAAGLCLVVAPITVTALGALDAEHAGLASGVNNAVARVGSLIAVAVLPVIAGAHAGTRFPQHGYQVALIVAAGITAAGGVLAFVGLPRRAVALAQLDNVTA